MTPAKPGQALVHVRTPTFRRPEDLERCLESLRSQTWTNWICDVHDDDPTGTARQVVDSIGDGRIRYQKNAEQKFASGNIDQCFSRANPHDADYFCVVEDDNALCPDFMESGIDDCRKHGVEIVLRDQWIRPSNRPVPGTHAGSSVLDDRYTEKIFEPDELRLALLVFHGVSNGGFFWSRHARSDLEIGYACNATLQEYLRTYAIAEPIFISRAPMAIWANNAAATQRNLGLAKSEFRREIDLKRSIAAIQARVWDGAGPDLRARFLENEAFLFSKAERAAGLAKAHLVANADQSLSWRKVAELFARGVLIRSVGRCEPGLDAFLEDRHG